MRVLFAIREPYIPETIGGGVLGIHHYTLGLIEHGHDCEVLARCSRGLSRKDALAVRVLRKLSGTRWLDLWNLPDRKNGYTTHRFDYGLIPELLEYHLNRYRPDVVITQGWMSEEIALSAIELGYPAIIRPVAATCVEALKNARDARPDVAAMLQGPHVLIMSASRFMADRVRERLDLEALALYEVIKVSAAPVLSNRPGGFLTLVNPCVGKGLNVVLDLAVLLPHRKFLLLESWTMDPKARQDLEAKISSLPNVEFRTSTLDMAQVYRNTSLLLMPSQWEEAFGRVAVEAGCYGLPTVGSDIGGIPEAVGDGGVLLPPTDSAEKWAGHIERILDDESLYGRLSHKAHAHAAQLNPKVAMQRFVEVIENHVARSRSARSLASAKSSVVVTNGYRDKGAALPI